MFENYSVPKVAKVAKVARAAGGGTNYLPLQRHLMMKCLKTKINLGHLGHLGQTEIL
jgi:hypothetical protein